MAVEYSVEILNARTIATIDTIEDASLNPSTLEICTAAYAAVLVSIELNKPFANENSPYMEFEITPVPVGTATGTGTAAVARIKNGAGTVCIEGLTVDTAAADIIIDNTSIAEDDIIALTSGQFTQA